MAREIAGAPRVDGAAGGEQDALVHGPGLHEPGVDLDALVGVGEADQVDRARVQIGPHALPAAQPDLEVDPGIPGQGAHQLDAEARRPAIPLQIVEGSEVGVAAVHEARPGADRVRKGRDRQPPQRRQQERPTSTAATAPPRELVSSQVLGPVNRVRNRLVPIGEAGQGFDPPGRAAYSLGSLE